MIYRRGVPYGWLRKTAIAFLLYVLAEVSLTIWVGRRFGGLNTFLLFTVTAVVGLWTVRRQGFYILSEIKADLDRGALPGAALIDGLCVLAGGLLLVLPGLISDAAGLLLLVPAVRKRLRNRIINWLHDRLNRGGFSFISFRKRI